MQQIEQVVRQFVIDNFIFDNDNCNFSNETTLSWTQAFWIPWAC
jgi:hypothetical protein